MVTQVFHNRRWRRGTAWVLVAGILLQPLLAYLATPWVSQDQRGHYVLLCTLKGLQQVRVDTDQPSASRSDDGSCPALQLINLISSAKTVAPFEVPGVTLFAVAPLPVSDEQPLSLRKPSLCPIRAPPVV